VAAAVRLVVVVLDLVVRVAVIVVAGRPVQGGVIVIMGLSYGRYWWRGCGWRGIPSVGRGGGNAPVIGVFGGFVVRLDCGGKLRGAAAASEGPAFVGVNRGAGRHAASFGGPASPDIPRGIGA